MLRGFGGGVQQEKTQERSGEAGCRSVTPSPEQPRVYGDSHGLHSGARPMGHATPAAGFYWVPLVVAAPDCAGREWMRGTKERSSVIR